MLVGTAPAANAALAIDRTLPPGNVGTDYANFVTAQGGNGTPYRWSIWRASLLLVRWRTHGRLSL
ncbi:MAG: hypothetical protein ACR2H2_16805 [Solirubrobacteraceae bacterium]|jgi:hypothetical protein